MKFIPLTRGKYAIVDDEDYPLLSRFKWCCLISPSGRKEAVMYFGFCKNGRMKQIAISMHALVMGRRPRGRNAKFQIDHRNRNALDNRKENLRWASASQNSCNRLLKNKYGRGVGSGESKSHHWRKFFAAIEKDGKTKYLGSFNTAKEARDAYDAAAIKLHGKFAVLNRDHWKG